MISLRLSQASRQRLTRLSAKHGAFGALRNYGLPSTKPLLCQPLNRKPPVPRTISLSQQLGKIPQICSFHSKTLSLNPEEYPHERIIINLMKKKPVDFQEIENQLAIIERETKLHMRIHTFIGLVKMCMRIKNNRAAEAAERFVFEWMMKFYEQDRLAEPPKTSILGMTLQAWVNSRHSSSGKRTEAILDKMEDMERNGSLPFPIDTPIYNIVMKAYAIHGDVENAKAVFDRCMHAFEQGNESARPNVPTWNILMDACAKSGKPDAWKMAENLFGAMQNSYEEGILKDPPDVFTYTSVISACAKSKQPQRAEFWFREMYKDYKGGNAPAQPNARSFNAVIDAWANSETEEGAERSEKILNDMINYAKETELPVEPDTVSYSTVMIAYARVGLPRKAEAVLQRQYDEIKAGNKRAALNAQCFNAIIHGWAKAKENISGERAELVLNRMVELHKQGILRERPNAHSYNNTINTWASLGELEKAREVFGRMLDDHKKGNKNAKPDVVSFTSLLEAYSDAELPNAGELADALLEEMKKLQVSPDVGMLVTSKMCWECSVGHDAKAPKRLKELQDAIDKLLARSKNKLERT